MRHAHSEALVEAAVLALVAVLLLDLAVALASVVLQLQPNGPPEKTLAKAEFVKVNFGQHVSQVFRDFLFLFIYLFCVLCGVAL